MGDFGYGIVKALVTDIDPDAQGQGGDERDQRRHSACASPPTEKGEAEKILQGEGRRGGSREQGTLG